LAGAVKRDLDGRQQTRLTFGTGYGWFPAWSPDGTHLVFQSNRSGNFEIWVMHADGSNPINLTNHLGEDVDAAWTW